MNRMAFSWGKKLLAVPTMMVFLGCSLALAQQTPDQALTPAIEKNENVALALTLLGTAASWAWMLAKPSWMALGAITVGPSLGYCYGGLPGRGLLGTGIRGASFGLLIVAVAISWDHDNEVAAGVFGYGALICFGASTLYDILSVRDAVKKNNLRLRARALRVSPVFIPQTKAVGVNFQIQF